MYGVFREIRARQWGEMNNNRGAKERKLYLEKQGLIKCGYCPYHRKENGKRRQRGDKYKTHRMRGKYDQRRSNPSGL